MRVAVLGAGGAHKTEASIARAARSLGHRCRLINVVRWRRYARGLAGRLIRSRLDAFQPEFVLLTRHASLAGEADLRLMLRGRRNALWYFDYTPTPRVIALGRLADGMYTTYLEQVEAYRAAGLREVFFLPQGTDPDYDRPARHVPRRYRCDASFVGSGQYPHRYPVLRAVASICDLQVRGPGWDSAPAGLVIAGGAVHGERFRQVVGGAAISIGASALPEQDAGRASASNRMWKILGCGGFYLGARVRDIELLATGGGHCAWYRSPEDAAEQVRHYLGRPLERQRIAEAGRSHALAHHTYAHRLELLFSRRGYAL